MLDDQWRIRTFDKDAQNLFGCPEALVLGRYFGFLMPPSDRKYAHRKELGRKPTPGATWRDLMRRASGERCVVVGRRLNGATFPMGLTVPRVPPPGPHRFAVEIRDLAGGLQRDHHRRHSETALIRTASLGEVDQLAAILVDKLIRPLTAVRNELAAEAGPFRTRERKAAALVMDLLMEIADRTSNDVPDLRAMLNAAVAAPRAMDVVDAIEAAGGLALAGMHRPLTLTIRARETILIDGSQVQFLLSHLIGHAAQLIAESAWPELVIDAAGQLGKVEISLTCPGPAQLDRGSIGIGAASRQAAIDGGYGLGQAIVATHGGELEVEERDDGGRIFRLIVPVANSAAPHDPAAARSPAATPFASRH